uniref:Ras modification protein ERF4 n=1 Tax=Phallusia mammillata TaxID=59560 RepID=A0A6F9DEI1_9ASCI|nr:golgin subfamily A member 7 [Phallusia mammillata]
MQVQDEMIVRKRIFIQRDFSNGLNVRFQTKFPPELDNKIEREVFENTIVTLNQMYADAERVNAAAYCEGCMACLSGYLLLLCMDTQYQKVLKKISRYIDEQNQSIYSPNGVIITDPFCNGLRSIEFAIYDTPDG